MARRTFTWISACGLTSLALAVVMSPSMEVAAASKAVKADAKNYKRPIRNPKFDPSAEKVDLFEAVDAGQVVVRLIPRDATGGNVLIENKTDKPLTVKIPEAVAGVSIHSQFNFPMGNQAVGNNQGLNNGANPVLGANRQVQGGGVQGQANGFPQQNNLFQGNGPGQGNIPAGINFFSIPAEKVVSLTFNSVCLEHGKLEPDSSCQYTLVPISRVSQDPVLHQLLATVGTGKVDVQTAQAAAWHLANKMSFQELAEKANIPLGGFTAVPYFSREQIQGAKQLIAKATEQATAAQAVEKTDRQPETQTTAIRTARSIAN